MSGGEGRIGLERLVDRGERVDEVGGGEFGGLLELLERSRVGG